MTGDGGGMRKEARRRMKDVEGYDMAAVSIKKKGQRERKDGAMPKVVMW